MNHESALLKRFLLWSTRQGWRLFRNSVGVGFVGRELRSYPSSTRSGAAVIYEIAGRRIRFGLCEGSSDLIGWRSVRVTAEMIGSQIAQFCACELKTENVTTTKEQINFLAQVRKAGGFSTVVREKGGAFEFDKGGSPVEVGE
ncbi:MAG TPA: hypothetical protein VFH17_08300 [Coriobacteriia bacterium]|nr:hypothetical protein [Coriobacteriia bacterium]